MTARQRAVAAIVIVAGLWLAGPACAQDAAEDEAPQMYGLELSPKDAFPNGNAVYLQGEADAKGQRFQVPATELEQPILVSVLTKNATDKVRVRLVKDDWAAPDRDVTTEGAERLDLGFRTFDGFKIWVTADEPTPYQLIVWVGAPLDIAPPPMAEPASTFVETDANKAATPASASGVSFSYLELILAAVLALVVIGFLAFLLMRRKGSNGVSP